MPNRRKPDPLKEHIASVLEKVHRPPRPDPRADDDWSEVPERPTQAKIREIERRYPDETYPPPKASNSDRPGKHWTPAGVVLVLGAVSALSVTLGAVLGPFFTKPDLSGYVKEERLAKCETKLDAREEAHEKASEELRRQTGKCYQALGDCRSQNGAQEQVIESMGTKRRR